MKKNLCNYLRFLLCMYGFSFSKEQKGNIYVDGFKRSFLVHLPKKRQNKPPIVFHGGMGKGRGTAKLTRFSQLSDRKGFIVVYPDAIKGHRNDGRGCYLFYSHRFNVNDVEFISKLIDYAIAEFKADPEKSLLLEYQMEE